MTGWPDLSRELDAWGEAGLTATFWWRDDDAATATPALDRLLALRAAREAPMALAVIPARADETLAKRLAVAPEVAVLQHGWTHANHAMIGAPKAEFGPDRDTAFMLGELARGWIAIGTLFGTAALPVLVPPHNRIAPALAAALPAAAYAGLSTYGARKDPIRELIRVNTHIDIMNWRTRRFLGEEAALDLAVAHLKARRAGIVDPDEPTGLLTHHLAHDEEAWRFADAFLDAVRAHAAARLCAPRMLFVAP